MTTDATFEDGREAPVNIGAVDAEDLSVVSMLVQDAVLPVTEISWWPSERRFALLVNRFRWEDEAAAKQRGRQVERVQSLLVVDNVTGVASQGVRKDDPDVILSILSVAFETEEEPSGNVILTMAGDGAIRLAVEALDVTLKDVTRPYAAPSSRTPVHPD